MAVGRPVAVAFIVVCVSALVLAADPPITAAEARDHVGKRVTVCGDIASIGHAQAKGQGGKQTFLHFDQAPPRSPFTAVIIGNDLFGGGAFWGIEKKVERKRVCVTGYVKRQGSAESAMMLLDAPNQLKVVGDAGQ